jgi:hypothetical protein
VELNVGLFYRWEQNQFFIPLSLVSTTSNRFLRQMSLEFMLLLVIANLKVSFLTAALPAAALVQA